MADRMEEYPMTLTAGGYDELDINAVEQALKDMRLKVERR